VESPAASQAKNTQEEGAESPAEIDAERSEKEAKFQRSAEKVASDSSILSTPPRNAAQNDSTLKSPSAAESKFDIGRVSSRDRSQPDKSDQIPPSSSDKPRRASTPGASESKSTPRPVKPSPYPGVESQDKGADEEKRGSSGSKTEFYEKADQKYDTKSTPRDSKEGVKTPAPSTPLPSENPPEEIIASFRSAKKAIESSGSGQKKRRERSESLEEVLKDHPALIDPLTGELVGTFVPSEDVLEHQQRVSVAKNLVNIGTPSSRFTAGAGTPERETAVALTDTAKALEGKMTRVRSISSAFVCLFRTCAFRSIKRLRGDRASMFYLTS
jgi:hypothetical protein